MSKRESFRLTKVSAFSLRVAQPVCEGFQRVLFVPLATFRCPVVGVGQRAVETGGLHARRMGMPADFIRHGGEVNFQAF